MLPMKKNFYSKNNKGYFGNNKGQALLFVVVAMTIALTIGVAVSSRTLSSLKRTTSTDTSSRVFSAAEGGIEWFLRQPISVLEALADGDTNNGADCPAGTTADPNDRAGCLLRFDARGSAAAPDRVSSVAKIKVGSFTVNSTVNGDNYWFNLDPGAVKEVKLRDFDTNTYYRGRLNICWKSLDSSNSSGLYIIQYGRTGVTAKTLISPRSIVGVYTVTGDTVASAGTGEYTDCYNLNINSDLYGIRFKSLYVPSKVAVFPRNTLPKQGFTLTSSGSLNNVDNDVRSTKNVVVYRSLPYAPAVFDYAMYTEGNLQ